MAGTDGDSWIFHSVPGLPSSLPQDGEENFFPWFFREMLFPGAEGRRRGSPLLSQKHKQWNHISRVPGGWVALGWFYLRGIARKLFNMVLSQPRLMEPLE